MVKGLAFHLFHAVERATIRQGAGIMHRNNAGVLQTRQNHSFLHEPRGKVSRAVFSGKNFYRDRTLQNGILRQPDCSHSAVPKKLKRTIARTGEVWRLHFGLQAGNDLVWKKLHEGATPSSDRASR